MLKNFSVGSTGFGRRHNVVIEKTKFFIQIEGQTMSDSQKFLSGIYDLLVDGKVFDTNSTDLRSIVDFKHPEELKVRKHSLVECLFAAISSLSTFDKTLIIKIQLIPTVY